MSSAQLIYALVAIVWIVLTVWLTYFSAKYFMKLMKNKAYSPRPLFKNFGQKMWMTVWLGCLFFGFYYVLVLLLSKVMDPSVKLDIFFLVYRHPVEFIYLGLIIFACMTVSIYIVRTIIIHLYNIRNK